MPTQPGSSTVELRWLKLVRIVGAGNETSVQLGTSGGAGIFAVVDVDSSIVWRRADSTVKAPCSDRLLRNHCDTSNAPSDLKVVGVVRNAHSFGRVEQVGVFAASRPDADRVAVHAHSLTTSMAYLTDDCWCGD